VPIFIGRGAPVSSILRNDIALWIDLARSIVTRGVARTSFVNPDYVAAIRDFDASIEVLMEAMNKVFEDPDDSQKLLGNLQLAREFRERSLTASSNETD
jgi:hypothetical protein